MKKTMVGDEKMANGIYCKHNVLKHGVLGSFIINLQSGGAGILTAHGVSDISGIEYQRVLDCFYHWKKENNYPYVRRLKKKEDGQYRYKITKYGIETFLKLESRIRVGEKLGTKFKLNLKRRVKRMKDGELYYGINRKGIEMGLTEEDLLPEEEVE